MSQAYTCWIAAEKSKERKMVVIGFNDVNFMSSYVALRLSTINRLYITTVLERINIIKQIA